MRTRIEGLRASACISSRWYAVMGLSLSGVVADSAKKNREHVRRIDLSSVPDHLRALSNSSQGQACTAPIPAQPVGKCRSTDQENAQTDPTDKFSMAPGRLSINPCSCSTAVTACGPVYNKKIAGLCPSENEWHDPEPSFSGFPCVPLPSPNQKRYFSVFKVSLNMIRVSDSDLAVF